MLLSLARALNDSVCRLANRFIFARKKVDCRTDLRNIKGVLRIIGSGRIAIGRNTRINSGPRRNPIGGDMCVTLVCRGGAIEIGEMCGLSNCTIVADSRVTLEPEVRIGGGVKIYDTDFHQIDPELRRLERAGQFYGNSRPVTICRNAFIGAHAIILKGTTIGENSVVGAGSVVGGNIPPNQIWAGNPARFIRDLEAGAKTAANSPSSSDGNVLGLQAERVEEVYPEFQPPENKLLTPGAHAGDHFVRGKEQAHARKDEQE